MLICLFDNIHIMGVGVDEAIIFLTLLSAVLSFFIAWFVLDRYRKTEKTHLLIWFFAWSLVAFRTAGEVFLKLQESNILLLYFSDVLTIVHSVLWFIGLAILLELSDRWKYMFSSGYIVVHAAVAGYLYFIVDNRIMGALTTYAIFVPVIFFFIAWFFYGPARETKKLGLSLVSGAFFLWGLDYIVFGIPYYAYGNNEAAVVGWILGFIFRVMILLGFYYMVAEEEGGGE